MKIVKDAEWIATCLLKDLIKGSYVPDDLIQQLRHAALQRCNIRISNYVATTDGESYKEVVLASLTGVISETDIDIIRQLREEVALAEKNKDECQSKMDAICQQYFPQQLKNLQTIPGIKGRSATAIIAEVGTDMSPRFKHETQSGRRI